MVLQKRLYYGFNGYQVPTMPRASRSARGKSSSKKKAENPMCAFDLLATVAGKLLQEKETSSSQLVGQTDLAIEKDNIKKEKQDIVNPFKQEPYDQGSCDESVSAINGRLQKHSHMSLHKHHSHAFHDTPLKHTSMITNSDGCKMTVLPEDPTDKIRNEFGVFPGASQDNSNSERGSPSIAESHKSTVHEEFENKVEAETQKIGSVINGISPISDDQMEMDTKPPASVSSDSSVEVSLGVDHIAHGGPLPKSYNNVHVVSRDDDENSSGCTQPSTITMKTYRPPACFGDRRRKKLLASKYWKAAPTVVKDVNLSNSDSETKPVFRSRKMCYTRQRTQRGSTFKRRKLYERYSISTSVRSNSNDGIYTSPGKGSNGKHVGSFATVLGATESSSSMACQKSSFGSGDSHVRLSIKSFKVPELFVEMPENATVGSLKRTVLEAVNAILGSGLRVGVLLHGKKIRDDSNTLFQTGISCDDKLDNLGFSLEPYPSYSSPTPPCLENPQFHTPCGATQQITRCTTVPATDQGVSDTTPDPPLTNLGNCIESDHDSVPSPTDISLDKPAENSRAMVPIPPVSAEALAVVPLHRKSRRSELVQRRIRRPFSVSEVEALVQAVEELGTGRWRDVKLRAFENAKHRTYVDLKDKWKTLVHTARISPQQRRGEPVPQELLDRVLSAHAYWCQQQAKQQVKPQGESCLLL
ncbi:telomere repeat-binding protein 5-like [Aristolochia californica]|uniref:telomere repeat-binding protein 5-like n=1 Tax=Aristolochia californica TaxID=171875 RepID=UPI0035D9E525